MDDTSITLRRARELSTLGHLAEAADMLAQVLDREPGRTDALIEQGHLCRRRKDHAAALDAFERAAASSPKHVGISLEIVRSLRALDRLDEAEERLDGVLAAYPQDIGGPIERGHLCRKRGDHDAALAAFQKAAAIDDSHLGVKLEIAQSLRALGRIGEAETLLRDLVADHSGNATPLIALANVLADVGRAAEADALLDEAPAALQSHAGVAVARVHLARRRGDGDAVVRFLERAANLDPGNLDLRLDLAAEQRRRGQLSDAARLTDDILAAHPDNTRGWMEMGYIRRAAGERREAVAAFTRAESLNSALTQALVELAIEAWTAGEAGEARAFLDRALAQEPDHLGALLITAEHALKVGDPRAAAANADRAVEAHPGRLEPLLFGARAAAAIPDRSRAIAFIETARTRFGERPETAATHIHVLRTLGENAGAVAAGASNAASHEALWAEIVAWRIFEGDFNAAAGLLDALPEPRRSSARAHFFRGQLAEAERRYSAAIEAYRRALQADPWNGAWHGELARACLLQLDLGAARTELRQSIERWNASGNPGARPHNPSQEHLGQLLDDFALDAEVLDRLRAVDTAATDAGAGEFMAIVRDRPDSTAAALKLILAFRSAGGFSESTATSAPSRIPHRIVQFWDGANPPDDIGKLMASWDDEDGRWQHRVFDEQAAEVFLRKRCARSVVTAFRRADHPAQRADIFRLAYLAREGGIYADADDRRTAPLSALLPAGATLVAYQENYGTIGNNFLAAMPRHPVIVRALKLATAAVNRGDRDTIWLSTGPGLVTRALAQAIAEDPAADWCRGMVVRELFEMRRLVDIHCPALYKSTPRHWSRAA